VISVVGRFENLLIDHSFVYVHMNVLVVIDYSFVLSDVGNVGVLLRGVAFRFVEPIVESWMINVVVDFIGGESCVIIETE
jgi:hypothetical protein